MSVLEIVVNLLFVYFEEPWKGDLQEVPPADAKTPEPLKLQESGQTSGCSHDMWDREIDGA
jgi:hypothetical protein